MATSLTLRFFNQSAAGGYCAVVQSDTGPFTGDAWLKEYANPDGSVAFTWTTDYAFCWTDAGARVPGVQVAEEQLLPSDLQSDNAVTLTYDTAVASFAFTNQRQGQQSGTLAIVADAGIPPGMASVGLAQSGAPVVLIAAQPNMTYQFQPSGKYYLSFGKVSEQGATVAVEWGPLQALAFPAGISSMDATLAADGSWTIQPTHL